MPRLFVCRPLPVDPREMIGRLEPGVEVDVFEKDRPPSRQELLARAHGADGLVTLLSERIDAQLLDALPSVRVVANVAVGYDNVDLRACAERGVWVTHTPGVLTEATADLAFTLLLAVARRVREGERLVRSGGFHGWSPTMLLGLELGGLTLGIYGYGRIGRAVGRRAEAFGMQVLGCSRSSNVSKRDLLERSDVISLHCPLTAETRHAFDDEAFARMRRGAILVNTARGAVVDEAALVRALESGRLRGAGLDVYEEEPAVSPGLVDRDDVVLLPHLGSATERTRRRMAEMALEDAVAVVCGREPANPVPAAV